tara:strand:+ start:485 stop:712 length:228 start_codon:yes stop_codon:yes gene_type:complete
MGVSLFLDNGLSKEQQEEMDNIYEALMSEVKNKNIKLYQRLRSSELTEKDVLKLINTKNKNVLINDKEQLEFFGD